MKKKIFLLTLFTNMATLSFAETTTTTRASKLILSTLASQCPQVVTSSVSASLGTLQVLYGIVDELKNDKDCAGAEQLAGALSRYGDLYGDFQTQKANSRSRIGLEKKIALYSSLATNPNTSSSQLDFLNSEILQSQADLISINSDLSRFESFSGREARGANQVISSLDSFLSSLAQDQGGNCYRKHGAQISSLISNSLLAASAFSSPGASLALASGGVIVSSLSSYVDSFKYNETLNLLEDAEMPIALRCASQVLTDQYCSADAVKNLLSERLENENTPQSGIEGINLLAYHLGPLSKWLDQVYAGSKITSIGDYINRNKPIEQSTFLVKVKMTIDTYGTMQMRLIESMSNKQEISSAVAKTIQGLTDLMDSPSIPPKPKMMYGSSENTTENPIFATNSQQFMAWNLWKSGTVPDSSCQPSQGCSFENYIASKGIILDINNLKEALSNAERIVQLTVNRVNIERAKTVSVDAFSIMVDAKRELKGETNPYKALLKINSNAERISSYLSNMGCRENPNDCQGEHNKYFPQISNIMITQDLTEHVLYLIAESTSPNEFNNDHFPKECDGDKNINLVNEETREEKLEKKSFHITSCISKILKLAERGTDVYFSKLRGMVSYEMEARLAQSDIGNSLQGIIYKTKEDLLQSILNSYSSNDSSISTDEFKTGLETAQDNSRRTLEIFFDFFRKNISLALKDTSLTEGPKSDLCFRIIPYLSENNQSMMKQAYENCSSAKKSSYKNGPSIEFKQFIQKTIGKGPFKKIFYSFKPGINERAKYCSYADYHDSSLLFDQQINKKIQGRLQK